MQILFTRNDRWGSKLIRAVTGETVSHVAIRISRFVIHSRLIDGGVTIDFYREFMRNNTVVYTIPWEISIKQIDRDRYAGKSYDFGAFLYLGLRKLFPFLPKANLWQSTGMYMCTEFVTDVLGGTEDSLVTPGQLYEKLRRSKMT